MRCLCDFRTRKNEVCSAKVARRDQRALRCGFTRARRGRKWKKRSRVCFRQRHGGGRCATAPFQPSLRLRFTLPPAEPLTEARFIFHHEAKRRKLSNIWQWPKLRNPSNSDPDAQCGKWRFGRERRPWQPSGQPNRLAKSAACISGALPESVGQ